MHVARMGERRGTYRVLVGTPKGKRPLGRPKRRWVNTIKMDLQELGWWAWAGSIRHRTGTGGGHCKCGNEPPVSIKCEEFLD